MKLVPEVVRLDRGSASFTVCPTEVVPFFVLHYHAEWMEVLKMISLPPLKLFKLTHKEKFDFLKKKKNQSDP